MREGKVKILGKEYPACLSTRTMMNITSKTGKPFAAGINELLSSDDIEGMFWLLGEMLKAGKKYHDLIGDNTPDPPSADDLMDTIGFSEYNELARAIYQAATDSSEAEVDTVDDPN